MNKIIYYSGHGEAKVDKITKNVSEMKLIIQSKNG
jgi:hypothetical protein